MDARVKPTAVRHGLCLMERTALILLDSSELRINWTRERTNAVPHQNIVFYALLKHIPWVAVDRLVEQHDAEPDPRGLKVRAHLLAMLFAQLSGARSLREIETSLRSHCSKLYHLGACAVSRSTLSTANASCPSDVFAGLLSALMAQLQRGYRRKIRDCVRLIDSTSLQLSSLSGDWARFSAEVCGAKAHIIYDPHTDQPLYLMVTAANVNDITAALDLRQHDGVGCDWHDRIEIRIAEPGRQAVDADDETRASMRLYCVLQEIRRAVLFSQPSVDEASGQQRRHPEFFGQSPGQQRRWRRD